MTVIATESQANLINSYSSSSNNLRVFKLVGKIVGVLGCLYFFVVSLNLMSISFPLIAGKYASEAFRSNVVLNNPLAGLMIGVLSTVVVQSSSTSTSIIVSLVASEMIPVKYAIPIIMGSNIGTSITSTLVALSQANDSEKFRLSFAGATVHDMFNLLSVAVLLPTEILTNYLQFSSGVLVNILIRNNPNAKEPKMLSAITQPLTDSIIQIDKHVLDSIATNKSYENFTLIKRVCKASFKNENEIVYFEKPCKFLFSTIYWPEWLTGTILLIASLVILSTCLVLLVKIMSSLLNGPVAKIVQRLINSEFPGIFKYLTGFVAIMIGCFLTIMVQSSSVFTSTLTPLVGMGLVSIERVFPLTLGSNIGTTITGILASLSGPGKTLKFSMQIALCHTLFNITGILIWYPIPYLRQVPIRLAKLLGDTTAKYKWFAIAYLIGFFFLIPAIIFSLSLLGKVVFVICVITVTCLSILVTFIKFLQLKFPEYLPDTLRTFEFLPEALRSLKPYDNFLSSKLNFLKCFNQKMSLSEPIEDTDIKTVTFSNDVFENDNENPIKLNFLI